MFPTKILLATNGSEESVRAETAALELAESTGSELHVVYVVATVQTPPTSPATARVHSESRLEARRMAGLGFLDGRVRKLESESGLDISSHYREGRADKEVVRLADDIGAGLIVCGGTRRTGMERILGVGFSEYVEKKASSPVLVVGGDAVNAQKVLR